MEIKKIIGLFLCLCTVLSAGAQTRVIAHRGYWKTEGSAQNSVTALQKAAEAGLYGSEFDVRLTADDVVVVNHNPSFRGRSIASAHYEELEQLKLKNGEKLPMLDEYLRAGKKLEGLRLVLEAKKQASKEREDLMAQLIVDCVKKHGLENRVDYISFSMNLCEQFLRLCPDANIAYLKGDLSPREVKEKGLNGIDYRYTVLQRHPEWIEEAHDLGMTVNSWTVNKAKTMQKLVGLGIDFLTTNEPLKALEVVKEEKKAKEER